MTPIAALDGIEVKLGRTPVLRRVDFTVAPGEVVGVIGPNGSGKTTLLKVLATLLRPWRGAGTLLGARLGSDEVRKVRRRIGLAGHEPALWPELSLRENLVAVARLAGRADSDADAALRRVGLWGAQGRPAGRASHGMRRRVDLARLLLTRPDLVLLDEAAAGLDSAARTLIETVVADATASGGAAVLVSHDTEHLGTMVGRVVAINDGVVGGATGTAQ